MTSPGARRGKPQTLQGGVLLLPQPLSPHVFLSKGPPGRKEKEKPGKPQKRERRREQWQEASSLLSMPDCLGARRARTQDRHPHQGGTGRAVVGEGKRRGNQLPQGIQSLQSEKAEGSSFPVRVVCFMVKYFFLFGITFGGWARGLKCFQPLLSLPSASPASGPPLGSTDGFAGLGYLH